MGLRQGGSNQGNSDFLSVWLSTIVATIIVLGIGILGDAGREFLAYERGAIASGELWRLVTAHFVHTGPAHLVYNVAGLWVIWYLVCTSIRGLVALSVWVVSIAGVTLGLWLFEPGLSWYVGLSGVLHGLVAAGLMLNLRSMRAESWVVAVALAGKLVYEQLFGPLPGSEESTGVAVIVDAHLYGALAGAACGVVLAIMRGDSRAQRR